jgi:hypothetical protein
VSAQPDRCHDTAVVFWVQCHDAAVVFWLIVMTLPSSSGLTIMACLMMTVIALVHAVLGQHQNGVVNMVPVNG